MSSSVAKKRQYNYSLDFFKGVLCIYVVVGHCKFPGDLGEVVAALLRCCIMYFFMASGYYCYYGEGTHTDKMRAKVNHILSITVWASLFYLVFAIVQHITGGEQIAKITAEGIINWIVFNEPIVIAGQLWFLFVLLYTYFLYMVVNKYNLESFAYKCIPVLLIILFFMQQGLHIAGVRVENFYYRNFLIEGFPFVMIGHWIHKNQDKLKVNNKILIAIFFICTILNVVEKGLFGRDFPVSISCVPQGLALFLYAVNNPNKLKGKLQILGSKYSLYVYIFHPFVWRTMERVYEMVGIENNLIARCILPIIIIVITLCLALSFVTVTSKIKKR